MNYLSKGNLFRYIAMLRVKQLTNKGFVRLVRQNLKTVKIGLPSALCKGGEANYERAT